MRPSMALARLQDAAFQTMPRSGNHGGGQLMSDQPHSRGATPQRHGSSQAQSLLSAGARAGSSGLRALKRKLIRDKPNMHDYEIEDEASEATVQMEEDPEPEPEREPSFRPPPIEQGSALDAGFMQSGLQQKLRVIEQIRVMLAGTAVSCPGIVVIGSQNAGKSSLLETISGISFPRGEGLCTRCPTVVSLEVDPTLEPHLILATDPGYNSNRRVLKLSSSQGEVRREIARLMAMMANKGAVTKDPVYIKVVREKGITLTMCDLPGITAMSSSQHDIEEQTVEMTEEWASNPNMIILCCVQAQDDFHNSKALKIALKYDPQGMRTLGIVTKVDMLPTKGDFASRLLMENHGDVRLEAHGFIAIRNQTKDEADRRVDAAYLQQAEKELFSKHGQLRVLPPDRWGVRTLVGKLQHLQMGQLDQALPQLATDVKKQIAVAEGTIARLPATAKTPQEQRFLLLDVVQNCSLRFQELITATDTNPDFEMHIAARSFDLISAFVQSVSEKVPSFLEDAQLAFISQQVAETRGVYLSNFLHGAVFRRIVKAAFEVPLMDEAKRLVEDLAATVKRCLATLLESATPDHPALCERLVMTAHELADKERTRAQTLVSDKIAAEMTTPFTMNADYQRLLNEFEELLAADSSNSYISAVPSASSSFSADFVRSATEDVRTKGAEAAMVRRLQVSLYAYQRVLQARLFDCIPMDVRNRIMYQLHDRLAPTLLSDEPNLLPLLADEKPEIAATRNEAEALLGKLRKAETLINSTNRHAAFDAASPQRFPNFHATTPGRAGSTLNRFL